MCSQPIQVTSEINPLREVLLHRPGKELEHLVPESLDRLLFDDIPYLKAAQQEHDLFAEALRLHGVQVVYLEDLMAETLAQSDETKRRFLEEYISVSGSVAVYHKKELMELFLRIPSEKEMVLKTMAGVGVRELKNGFRGQLARKINRGSHFILEPIPNLYFTRDPFAAIGRGVSLNRMYSVTRNRETIYGKYILSHHPTYKGNVPFYYRPDDPFHMEGGDILVLSESTLAVGISQRTSPEAVELLAERLFTDEGSGIHTILAFDIPNIRAYMHLDTVFTQADTDKFIVHPKMLKALRLYKITKKDGSGAFCVTEYYDQLIGALCDVLELSQLTLISCGGRDDIASEREQWNDGANTLCLSPGTVAVYDRNRITNDSLREHGLNVIELPSSELSRGRGGPRCMSMPLRRE